MSWPVVGITFLLLLLKVAAEWYLGWLNRGHVRRHGVELPPDFAGMMDQAAYRQSVAYTLAKGRFAEAEDLFQALLLVLVLGSGVLPWVYGGLQGMAGSTAWAAPVPLLAVIYILSVPGWPWEWWAQFRLEARFGFNRYTSRLWWTDKIKEMAVGLALVYPLLLLLFWLVQLSPLWWWWWGFGCVLAFQLVMAVLYPMVIMPLFNKFEPLQDAALRDRLQDLARRAGFRARTILVMDGSRRSTHSNAYFAGFGRWRRIVLYDTLIEQLTPEELEAVLAHEIGHYKKGHIPKILAVTGAGLFLGFWILGRLTEGGWLAKAFGFPEALAGFAATLLLFSLLKDLVTFWLTPLFSAYLRRNEYEADAFAREVTGGSAPLIGALRKLHAKNLGNLTPHPLYSRFYYSHPTLLEREQALRAGTPA